MASSLNMKHLWVECLWVSYDVRGLEVVLAPPFLFLEARWSLRRGEGQGTSLYLSGHCSRSRHFPCRPRLLQLGEAACNSAEPSGFRRRQNWVRVSPLPFRRLLLSGFPMPPGPHPFTGISHTRPCIALTFSSVDL